MWLTASETRCRFPRTSAYTFCPAFSSGNNPPAAFPGPAGMCESATNPNYHGPTVRALLMALDAWSDRGVEPPVSN